ncbi:hypothetical protein DVS28_a0517 [Euzebya pacifica]|jgi:hypothetical protein|uniref:Uncharacterized protein n=1 Tax=Euzebya pacifica TaxID=1608957 RepID=A0A346XSM7_9ACTN|nr:hypothetical protein [Euzebya pacifica]AXV05224.1 hypothetical protein DVS28_a0517 [Euzebya pacifica]
MDSDELPSAAFGLLALALSAGAALGVLRPGPEGMADNVPILAFAGLIAGVVGLYVGKTRGLGRQMATLGAAAGLLAILLFGGSIAVDAILNTA